MNPSDATVGILALQGDFAEHRKALARFGVATRLIRRPHDLVGLDGLILPGGESSTMLRLIRIEELFEPLHGAIASGLPTHATCAGLILLAREVLDPQQESLHLLDVTVHRNGYGRQVHSGTVPLVSEFLPAGTEGVFIRAPRVARVGPGVEVLARRGDDPVLLRRGAILASCFHPELQPHHPVTAAFVQSVLGERHASPRRSPATTDAAAVS